MQDRRAVGRNDGGGLTGLGHAEKTPHKKAEGVGVRQGVVHPKRGGGIARQELAAAVKARKAASGALMAAPCGGVQEGQALVLRKAVALTARGEGVGGVGATEPLGGAEPEDRGATAVRKTGTGAKQAKEAVGGADRAVLGGVKIPVRRARGIARGANALLIAAGVGLLTLGVARLG